MSKLTIQGLEFETGEAPYKDGDVINANEAAALNQTWAENLRNNFAGQVKAAREAAAETNGFFSEVEGKKVFELDKVTDDMLDIEALNTKFAEYVDSYEFGARRAGGTRAPADPVEREAIRIATAKVKELLRAKEIKISEVPKEQLDGLVAQALEKLPAIREQARQTVEANKSISLEGLSL